MTFQLRDYQVETIDNVLTSMKNGHRSIIVQQPPRTGKTVIMSEIARRTTANHNRILFLVHRKEIVDQVKKTFVANDVDMNLATIGMVQTLTRRVETLKQPAIIFVDEAHHVLAKSYRRILDAFPDAFKLLFTATPTRLSGEGFEEVADDLIQGKQVSWLIEHGNLAPVDYYAPKQIDTNLLKQKRTGEFTEDSIEQAMKPKIYGNAVNNYRKLADGKQAIAYTYNVASAKKLADAFNQAGISACSVDGKTPKDEREKIINDYRNGTIQIVTNAELFTEGLDLPNVDCVIMLRPTQSLSLFLQFGMRAMNPREGKTAIIIDHVGNVERFGLPTDDRNWSLSGTEKQQQTSGETIKGVTVCESCFSTFYRTSDVCPNCGATLTEEKVIEVVEDAELQKIEQRKNRAKQILEDKALMEIADKKPSELNSYAQLKAYAKLHGYKPGWVYFQAKTKGLIKA